MGLATVTGVAERGFFIPYRFAGAISDGMRQATYDAMEPVFERAEPAFAEVLANIESYADALLAIGGNAPPAPRWDQVWFPRLDAAAAYTIVRRHLPRRIVEVGSGHSTRFFVRAVFDAGSKAEITAIDPAPRADIAGLGVTCVRRTVQQAEVNSFRELAAGDALSIDSSHVLQPGTDVDYLLNRVLPTLPPGVLVHLHDVFLPDAYPPQWAWRGYNEQLGVAALLQGGWRPFWSSHYVSTRMTAALAGSVVAGLPLRPGAVESSIWLVRDAKPED